MLQSHSLCIEKINDIYGQIQSYLQYFFLNPKKVKNDNSFEQKCSYEYSYC